MKLSWETGITFGYHVWVSLICRDASATISIGSLFKEFKAEPSVGMRSLAVAAMQAKLLKHLQKAVDGLKITGCT